MTGWLLIAFLLILGGVISTLGDFLGTKIGKARLSIFKLRPRRTAVLITIITGSLISSLSLMLMLLVDRQLRDGLFRLNDIQAELRESREALLPLNKQRKILETRIEKRENELIQLEKDFSALRKGQVVISSGQSLGTFVIQLGDKSNVEEEIEKIIKHANFTTFIQVKPGEKPIKRMLLLRKDHVEKIKSIISDGRKWVINIRSAGNILLGENYVQAFPEVLFNKSIVVKDEIIASNILDRNDFSSENLQKQIKLLLSSTLAEVKRRGSLVSEIQVDTSSINSLPKKLKRIRSPKISLETISLNDSDIAEKVIVKLRVNRPLNKKDSIDI